MKINSLKGLRTRLSLIYLLAYIPLITGSLLFFYWYYNRIWFAKDISIELPAFFTLLIFLIFSLIAIVLMFNYYFKKPVERKRLIIPAMILLFTVPVIDLFATIHDSLCEKAFVRIINDTDKPVKRIWSDNFEMIYSDEENKDFIISYYPVYTYDWSEENSGMYNYAINEVYFDIKTGMDSTATYEVPVLSKGDCRTVYISRIIGISGNSWGMKSNDNYE